MSAADAATLVAANLQLVAIYEDNSSFNYLNLSHFLLAAYVMSNTIVRSQHPVPGAMGNN